MIWTVDKWTILWNFRLFLISRARKSSHFYTRECSSWMSHQWECYRLNNNSDNFVAIELINPKKWFEVAPVLIPSLAHQSVNSVRAKLHFFWKKSDSNCKRINKNSDFTLYLIRNFEHDFSREFSRYFNLRITFVYPYLFCFYAKWAFVT